MSVTALLLHNYGISITSKYSVKSNILTMTYAWGKNPCWIIMESLGFGIMRYLYVVSKVFIISAQSMKMVTSGSYSRAIHNAGEISTIVTPFTGVPFSQLVSLDLKKLMPVNGIGISISGSYGTSQVPVMSVGLKSQVEGYDWKTDGFMEIGTNASVETWIEMNHGWARSQICVPGSVNMKLYVARIKYKVSIKFVFVHIYVCSLVVLKYYLILFISWFELHTYNCSKLYSFFTCQ